MKKIILSIMTICVLSACGGGNETSYDKNITSLQETAPVIQVEVKPTADQVNDQNRQAEQSPPNIPGVTPQKPPEPLNRPSDTVPIEKDQKPVSEPVIKEVNPIENSNVQ